ncbi:ABC transporter ATP-binding protein [Auritidibacter ignavus]|uniref:ABC transporter ATP-binding protein n=1 Tax=Auritidibacter ignavus TaxID=678932 RepID=UPI003CC6427C
MSSVAPSTQDSGSNPDSTHLTSGSRLSVTFDRVGRSFPTESGERTILRDISFTVAPGEILSIIGASGSGKSTLLRTVGGLDTENSGEVLIGGDAVQAYDPRTAVGFQEPRLLPWRSIAANVTLGLPRGTGRRAGRERVAELLNLVGLSHATKHRPREISGGMAQRASLARALARSPEVLLLDEPFGALDALTRIKMQQLLLDVHAATGTTILLVTHDVDEALHLSDHVMLLGPDSSGQPGATVQEISPVPGERPRDLSAPELVDLAQHLYQGLGVTGGADAEVTAR